jgi:hypothetical protein
LFSLPHLLTRKTKGKASLIDYSSSHVVTLDILQTKIITKEIVTKIMESKCREREAKQNRKIIDEGIIVDLTKQRSREKHAKVEVIESKSTIVVVRRRRPRTRRMQDWVAHFLCPFAIFCKV